MIVGIGTDIVAVARMAAGIERHGERFAQRILSDDEMTMYRKQIHQANHLAKRFAAKEAVVKSLGCGFRDGISMRQVVISNDSLGKPEVTLSDKAAERAEQMQVGEIFLSLSDERDFAIAYVVAQKTG
ncbi:MAG: holo-ACP synthase [Gammaproteobacteria bacterium]|nr:holo-ACP synthase [Gammaproteobacteria bacterium]